jgi:hypothetical protein
MNRKSCRSKTIASFCILVLALLAFLLSGCAKKGETVYATSDYPTWKKTTDTVLAYPIPGHMDRLRIPRMNATGFSVVPTRVAGKLHWDFPENTVIVKEVYATPKPAPGEGPIQLTIMVKAPKDPRSQGGWLWLTRDLPSGAEQVFAGNFCVTCHANANEGHPYFDNNKNLEFRDYVYFVPLEAAVRAK